MIWKLVKEAEETLGTIPFAILFILGLVLGNLLSTFWRL